MITHFVGAGGAHEHTLGQDASHFGRFQIAHEDGHSILHLLQRHVLNQTTDNGARPSLTQVHLFKYLIVI